MVPYIFGMSMLRTMGPIWEQQMRVTQVLMTAAVRHNLAMAGFGTVMAAPARGTPVARHRPAPRTRPRLVVPAAAPACSTEASVNNLPV